MPSFSPDGEPQRLATTPYTPADDVYERLKTLELQRILEYQRQRDQVEEELHKLREQLVTMARAHQHQHQATLAAVREGTEELRQEVADALHRLSQDMERVAQHAEAQASRAVERLRHELLETLFERNYTTVQRHMLGELLVTLGRHLQEAGKGEGL
jgi:cell division septum initiation protein DivIVA